MKHTVDTHVNPLESHSSIGELNFSKALASFRAGVPLLHSHPDKLMLLVAKMAPEEQREVLTALALLQEASGGIEKLLHARDHNRAGPCTRKPHAHEPHKIALDRTTVFLKESTVEYEMRVHKINTHSELRAWYEKNGRKNIDTLFERHQAHASSCSELKSLLGHDRFYHLSRFTNDQEVEELLRNEDPDCVIILGGDDTIKTATHLVQGRLVWLLNSDAEGSVGAHCTHTKPEFKEQLERMQNGNFLIEEWPLLEAEITNPRTGEVITTIPALNEMYVGDELRKWPFRAVLLQEGKKPTRFNGDGLIFSTPAGYSGWYGSETEAPYPLGHSEPNTTMEFELFADGRIRNGEDSIEDITQSADQVQMRPGLYTAEDPPITIRSTSYHSATVIVDSVREYPLERDSEVVVSLSQKRLKVISGQAC